jgi:hypothetical protein
MLPADVAVPQRLWHHRSSPALTHQESASLSKAMHGSKARIVISPLNPLGLPFWTQPTSSTTRTAVFRYSLKWIRAMQDGERVPTGWYTLRRDILMKKAEEGRATQDRGGSFNGPAKLGPHLSSSSRSFIVNLWQGC